jgi:hypothetical protein
MKKIVYVFGAFYLIFQFTTLTMFDQMLRISKLNEIPIGQLAGMQMKIINFTFLITGIIGFLLIVLLSVVIWKVFVDPKMKVNEELN